METKAVRVTPPGRVLVVTTRPDHSLALGLPDDDERAVEAIRRLVEHVPVPATWLVRQNVTLREAEAA